MSIESGSAGKYCHIERKPFALESWDVSLFEQSTSSKSVDIVLNTSAVAVFLAPHQAKMREVN